MTNFPAVKEDLVTWGFRDRIISHNHKAIVNPESKEIYAIASNQYKIVKHEEILETVEHAIAENPEYGNYESSVWLSDNGAKMHANLRFSDIKFPVSKSKGDLVNPTIDIFNSYDGSWSLKVVFGAFRLVCSNGLTVGETFMMYKRKHFSEGIDQERIKQMLMGSLEQFSFQTELWKSWADRITTSQEYENVMEALPISEKDREAIGEEVEVSSDIRMDAIKTKTLTFWLFYNILCQYLTHKVTSEIKRANIQNAMRNFF
uniref:DUF932 domain-containing protein n=1 Tax=viral metagenome TaxID=1070528 RepID=A0A6M3MED0_9ZZZZ